MSAPTVQFNRREALARLLEASRQNRLTGLADMLRAVAESAQGFGAIMWEVAPGADLDAVPATGRLFMLGSWFRNPDVRPWYLLRLAESFTGSTILAAEPQFSPQLRDEPLSPARAKQVLGIYDVQGCLSMPLLLPQFNKRAAVNIYWNTPVSPDPPVIADIAAVNWMFPDLYAGLVDRVGLNLMEEIDQILRRKVPAENSSAKVDAVLNKFVQAIAAVFNCREASVFLDESVTSQSYSCKATTWPWKRAMPRRTYTPDNSLTGYTLRTREPVRILDLGAFDEELDVIRDIYPGIIWNDRQGLEESVRDDLNCGPGDDLPPLSFMCVPVISNDRVLGAIRCSICNTSPYFFDDRHVSVLQLAARRLGGWWETWIERTATERENALWERVIASVGDMNSLVHRELNKPVTQTPNENNIFVETMRMASELVEDTAVCDVRLRPAPTAQSLRIASTYGSLWDKGSQREILERKRRDFPLGEAERPSAAAHVFRTRRPYIIDVDRSPKDPYYDPTFPEVKHVILAPLLCGRDVYGTLGVRRTTDKPFSDSDRIVVELLANQLGLYHFLAEEVQALGKSQADLQWAVETQHRMPKTDYWNKP